MKKTFRVENLGCANCAAKIETAVNKIEGVSAARVNFAAQTMTLEAPEGSLAGIAEAARAIAEKIEPGIRLTEGRNARWAKNDRAKLARILIAGAGFAAVLLAPLEGVWRLAAFLIVYLIAGGGVLLGALRGILRGQVFDENFLMAAASVGAFCLGEYPEGVAVMLFFQVGELFENIAVAKSRRSIAELMDIRPDYANLLRDGREVAVDPEEVTEGDLIRVRPGERVPLDGTVAEGSSALDTSALTGESAPRDVCAGDEVISGCINQTGVLTIRVTKEYGQSTVAKILELVENASDKKSKSESFITKFARYYTPIVVVAAVLFAVLPPLVTGDAFSVWIERALTFLVISCPCALVISVPLGFFGGIGGASRSGILIKGGNFLEALSAADTVVFDKTGTLTRGSFAVTDIHAVGMPPDALLEIAAYAEHYSGHPIAQSIRSAYGREADASRIGDVEEAAGFGVSATVDGRRVLAGGARLLAREGIACEITDFAGSAVHVVVEGRYAGFLRIEDEIKRDARRAVADLKAAGVRKSVMLTGDQDAVGRSVAAELGIDEVYTQLLPADKVQKLEELMELQAENAKLAYVGDGINDAPVLARADIGVAMGGPGSDAAIEAADIVIMTDEPSKVAEAMRRSKRTLRIVRQNIVFALGVKAVVLALGAMGFASMWAAVFADVGVSVLAILNSIRAGK